MECKLLFSLFVGRSGSVLSGIVGYMLSSLLVSPGGLGLVSKSGSYGLLFAG